MSHDLSLTFGLALGTLALVGTACPTSDFDPIGPSGGTLAAFCSGPAGQTGCCIGSRLVWCEGAKAVAIECAENQCGYYTSGGFYDCYAYDQGPNRDCPTSDATVCAPTCNGRCGVDDGCGGTCGCSASHTCQDSICVKGSTPTRCEDLMHIGCCDGTTRRFCKDGEETSEVCSDSCGWNPSGWYACGFSEGEPSGVWPRACD